MLRRTLKRLLQARYRFNWSKLEMTSRKLLLGGAVLGLIAMAGSAQSKDVSREHVITMASMSYGKIPSDIKAGDTITWVNNDTVPHTATARDRSFDLRIAPRKSARMTAKKAGAFPFYCILHPAMRGTLKVAAK